MNAEKENTQKFFIKMKKAVKKDPATTIEKYLRRYSRQKCVNDSTDFFKGEKYSLPTLTWKIAKDTQKSRRFTIPKKWRDYYHKNFYSNMTKILK